jgi:hypothetical protein
MSSINTFNALSECLMRTNNPLKPHHIYIEIRVLNPYSSNGLALNLHVHGLVQSIMAPHENHHQTDLNEMTRRNTFPMISYRRQIPLQSLSLIVARRLEVLQEEMDERRLSLSNLRTSREGMSLEVALQNVPTVVHEQQDLGRFFTASRSAKPKAIFLTWRGRTDPQSAYHFSTSKGSNGQLPAANETKHLKRTVMTTCMRPQ